jgi:DNA-binding NtrC family response regulator
MNEIMDAGLDKKEQRLLVSALDYLARLASVQKASAISGDRIQPVEVPGVKSEAMKAVYKKMAALSVTDLPIWISGERGVELDWIARTIHRIRGLPDDRHIVYEHGKTIVTVDAFLKKAQASYEDGALEATILFREIDQSPYELQKELHDIIMGRLDIMDSVRIMLTTEPIDLNSEVSNAIYPDLFAFLAPSSIEAPPLRKRTEDIRSLMEFFSHPKRKQGIFERLGNDAKEALFSYHWPRNTEELISVTRYIAARRPTGTIRVNHLPDNFHSQVGEELALKSVLEQIQIQEGFRALKDDAGRKALAQFLMSLDEKETFTPADLQRVFSMGRETSRRLLISLETRGVLEGIKGAKGQRISRYRILNSAKTIE